MSPIEDRRGAYRALVGKIKETRIFGRHGRRWDDNIKNGSSINMIGAWIGLVWLMKRTGGRLL
jgi:hypothetical protein